MRILVIARLTFLEAARRKIMLAAVLLGIVFLAVYGIGYYYIVREIRLTEVNMPLAVRHQIFNFLMLAGLYVVNFLTVMMTVLTSVDTLSGEISTGTIHTLLAKPLRRWELVLGKWLGFGGMLSLYLILMGGGVLVLVYLLSAYQPPHPFVAMGLLWLNALLLLTISFAGGSVLSTLANGVLVFGLFGVAFLGGWIEQVGSYLPSQSASQTAMNIGVVTSLLLPSEALWKRAAHELQSPLAGMLGFSPFSPANYPSNLMIVYAAGYLLVIFFLALRWFQNRDL